MGSRTTRTLVATAPDGTEVTQKTSGSYDTAGLLQAQDGHWLIAAHGWSRDSVYNRTHAKYNRGDYRAMHVTDLVEQTAPLLRDYFGTHQVTVFSAYTAGSHEGLAENDLRMVLCSAGATLSHIDGATLTARNRPGQRGHAGIQAAGAIAAVSYADGTFALEKLPANWYSEGIQGALASRSFVRVLARCGYTAIAFRVGTRIADFQVSELLKSMNARPGR